MGKFNFIMLFNKLGMGSSVSLLNLIMVLLFYYIKKEMESLFEAKVFRLVFGNI